MRYLKLFENITDDKIGKEFWFEYHCFESPLSVDAEIWYHTHQIVNVISISENGGGEDMNDRLRNGEPRVYKIKFKDGFTCDAFEDELLNSQKEYSRPDAPKKLHESRNLKYLKLFEYMDNIKKVDKEDIEDIMTELTDGFDILSGDIKSMKYYFSSIKGDIPSRFVNSITISYCIKIHMSDKDKINKLEVCLDQAEKRFEQVLGLSIIKKNLKRYDRSLDMHLLEIELDNCQLSDINESYIKCFESYTEDVYKKAFNKIKKMLDDKESPDEIKSFISKYASDSDSVKELDKLRILLNRVRREYLPYKQYVFFDKREKIIKNRKTKEYRTENIHDYRYYYMFRDIKDQNNMINYMGIQKQLYQKSLEKIKSNNTIDTSSLEWIFGRFFEIFEWINKTGFEKHGISNRPTNYFDITLGQDIDRDTRNRHIINDIENLNDMDFENECVEISRLVRIGVIEIKKLMNETN